MEFIHNVNSEEKINIIKILLSIKKNYLEDRYKIITQQNEYKKK